MQDKGTQHFCLPKCSRSTLTWWCTGSKDCQLWWWLLELCSAFLHHHPCPCGPVSAERNGRVPCGRCSLGQAMAATWGLVLRGMWVLCSVPAGILVQRWVISALRSSRLNSLRGRSPRLFLFFFALNTSSSHSSIAWQHWVLSLAIGIFCLPPPAVSWKATVKNTPAPRTRRHRLKAVSASVTPLCPFTAGKTALLGLAAAPLFYIHLCPSPSTAVLPSCCSGSSLLRLVPFCPTPSLGWRLGQDQDGAFVPLCCEWQPPPWCLPQVNTSPT